MSGNKVRVCFHLCIRHALDRVFQSSENMYRYVYTLRAKIHIGYDYHMQCNIISSPEPLGSQGELIVYPSSRRPSVGIRPPFLKIFSSETAWPIKAKFYVGLPWEGGTKIYINVQVK